MIAAATRTGFSVSGSLTDGMPGAACGSRIGEAWLALPASRQGNSLGTTRTPEAEYVVPTTYPWADLADQLIALRTSFCPPHLRWPPEAGLVPSALWWTITSSYLLLCLVSRATRNWPLMSSSIGTLLRLDFLSSSQKSFEGEKNISVQIEAVFSLAKRLTFYPPPSHCCGPAMVTVISHAQLII